ncbi:MAG: hypothetical protein HY040_17245 [Planctomycetes bacterium]|nr:hypothetical protein [Planctomycetota bacterium]
MLLAKDAVSPVRTDTALQVYLLGTLEYDAALRLQRRLQFDVSGDRSQAALILCEHPPMISVGRQGSRAHVFFEPDELEWRGWPVRWVHRGGGCWLHLPGQLAVYAVFPVDRLGLTVRDFLVRLGGVVQCLLGDFDLRGDWLPGGVYVRSRLIAGLGVAVHDWISSFGLCLNANPSLDFYRRVQCAPRFQEPMTSLERERRGRLQPALVRQRLIEHVREVFGFGRIALFSDHPSIQGHQQRCRAPVRNAYA